MPDSKRLSQTDSGKAWEYGLARKFADLLHVPFPINNPSKCGQKAYESLSDEGQHHADLAAGEAAEFLLAHDDRLLKKPQSIRMQSDMRGAQGDVRDIIIATETDEIGLSAKHRHTDLKHPRVSSTIDWPYLWTGESATQEYWRDVRPLFRSLEVSDVEKWRDLPDKDGDYYMPFLHAFKNELGRQYERKGAPIATHFMRYMIGRYDFYKVVKENGNVSLTAFNIHNSLGWGKRVPLPTEIRHVDMKPGSTNTILVQFNHGWELSMRIHNADSRLTTSLKFAVGLEGQPPRLTNHTILYGK